GLSLFPQLPHVKSLPVPCHFTTRVNWCPFAVKIPPFYRVKTPLMPEITVGHSQTPTSLKLSPASNNHVWLRNKKRKTYEQKHSSTGEAEPGHKPKPKFSPQRHRAKPRQPVHP